MTYLIRLKYLLGIVIFLSFCQIGQSQEVIEIINPSFEGKASVGVIDFFRLKAWQDCNYYEKESAPDIHNAYTGYFSVSKTPFDGKTFLGLVTREQETNEAIGQKLTQYLTAGFCYEMSVHLCRDLNYKSAVESDLNNEVFFNEPIKLIIWGGNSFCSKDQKLGETEAVSSSDWQEHMFRFNTEGNHKFITLEAYWITPTLVPYNGSILLDKISSIVQVPCSDNALNYELLAANEQNVFSKRKDPYQSTANENSFPTTQLGNPESTSKTKEPIIKIISGVQVKEFLKSTEQLQIRALIFPADTFNITESSYATLDEIYYFLKQNKRVSLEVSGHTNGLPTHEICDKLSTRRANAVKSYIVNKGVSPSRITAKGYGKRKPLVSNKTSVGRDRNQRVEIKIIKR